MSLGHRAGTQSPMSQSLTHSSTQATRPIKLRRRVNLESMVKFSVRNSLVPSRRFALLFIDHHINRRPFLLHFLQHFLLTIDHDGDGDPLLRC